MQWFISHRLSVGVDSPEATFGKFEFVEAWSCCVYARARSSLSESLCWTISMVDHWDAVNCLLSVSPVGSPQKERFIRSLDIAVKYFHLVFMQNNIKKALPVIVTWIHLTSSRKNLVSCQRMPEKSFEIICSREILVLQLYVRSKFCINFVIN